MNRSYILTILTFILSIIIVVAAFIFQDKLENVRSLGLFGIFLINLLGSATIFFPAPAIFSVFAGGGVYSPIAVALVSALGATLGDMIGFMLGYSGTKLFARDHRWYVWLQGWFKKLGGIMIFLFALIPNPFFDAIGIIAGAFSFSPVRFFILLFLGRLLRDIFLAYLGDFAFAR